MKKQVSQRGKKKEKKKDYKWESIAAKDRKL